MSVLFADLVGFTPLAEDKDPEAVRELLTQYFDTARLGIERHGGTVEKFIGDAVMAVWGTPIAHEDDAERAVRAAFEIVDAVRGLATGLEARAGVLTGEAAVTVGATGQGMVAGDLVNTAARLQAVAPAGSVLVGESTMRAASGAIAFEAAGEQELKGKAAPVPAWHALRVVAARGGQGRTETLEPPFVGRDEELRQLKDLLHATQREGRVRLVSVSGPAGIGKSRLVWELEKYADGVTDAIYWHRGRSPSYGEGITFWALGEMVRRRAGLAEDDDEATTRQRTQAIVADYVPAAEDRAWVEPALLTLLGVEPPPAGGRDTLFAAWRIFFERVAARGTTVLAFEDLQWADTGLLDFIDHLLDWTKQLPILVVTLARPELFDRRPDFGGGRGNLTAMALAPLAEADIRALLAGIVPGLPATVVDGIVARAEGVPLYAVEMVRALLADGRIERSGETYRPVGDLSAIQVPESLRSLIAARLDALPQGDRALLQDAAVLGQVFSPSALEAVTGRQAPDLEPRLRSFVRGQLLEVEADPRSPERGQYRFVQSLIREVAYGMLARRERRARHLAVARHYEAMGDEELAGALASHYLAAHEASAEGPEADAVAAQARIALRAAAQRAAGLGAHDQAVAHLEQALAVTADLGERAQLLELAAISSDAAGRQEAVHYAEAAIEAHRGRGDRMGVSRASALLGEVLLDASEVGRAIEVLQSAAAEFDGTDAETAPDDVAEAMAATLARLSRALMRNYDSDRAIDVADRALAIAERHNLDELVAESFINKGSALSWLGRRREAAALIDAAIRMASSAGWIAMELRARNNLAVGVWEDEPIRATETTRSAVDLARRVGNRTMFTFASGSVAFNEFFIGREWEGPMDLLHEALAESANPADRARLVSILGFFEAARGERLDEIVPDLKAAGSGSSDPMVAAAEHWNEATVALARGDLEGAHRAGLAAADEFPLMAHQSLEQALRAALWMRDVDRARSALKRILALPESGALPLAVRAHLQAAVAALEDKQAEALTGFRDAKQRMRQLEQWWYVALFALDAIQLLPEEPEVHEWAAEARSIFERLRAAPYLERLEAALSRAQGRGAPAPASRSPVTDPTEVAAG